MNRPLTQKKRKPTYERAVRMNITIPPQLHRKLPEVLTKYGFSNHSEYFQHRLRKDAGFELVE